MTDLTEFLLARFDEDDAVARDPHESVRAERAADMDRIEWDDCCGYVRLGLGRMLAESEAKRRIVEECRASVERVDFWYGQGDQDVSSLPARTLRLLALPYATHADYREEWRP
ncbi:MAG: DUF6221 family protein [Cellulomonas sp.]|uniref:DUF6221 family protein n=1 Tax=Cellulomonas sp. TaxID=40001 RepID=UPI00258EA423|nr:DUF6221 family protein [Cellulomonas sp.]MCR6706565.1 DUF6221 family protein [Cellulomonas sp.]